MGRFAHSSLLCLSFQLLFHASVGLLFWVGLDGDGGSAGLGHPHFASGFPGEIDLTIRTGRAPVRDSHIGGLAGFLIGDGCLRAERQVAGGGGFGIWIDLGAVSLKFALRMT